ncbi:MAG: type IV pilus biogenesis protein PilP [Alphaproteobacteria bacterium]
MLTVFLCIGGHHVGATDALAQAAPQPPVPPTLPAAPPASAQQPVPAAPTTAEVSTSAPVEPLPAARTSASEAIAAETQESDSTSATGTGGPSMANSPEEFLKSVTQRQDKLTLLDLEIKKAELLNKLTQLENDRKVLVKSSKGDTDSDGAGWQDDFVPPVSAASTKAAPKAAAAISLPSSPPLPTGGRGMPAGNMSGVPPVPDLSSFGSGSIGEGLTGFDANRLPPEPRVVKIRKKQNSLMATVHYQDGGLIEAGEGAELPGGWQVVNISPERVLVSLEGMGTRRLQFGSFPAPTAPTMAR